MPLLNLAAVDNRRLQAYWSEPGPSSARGFNLNAEGKMRFCSWCMAVTAMVATLGCSSGDDGAPGSVDGTVRPCNQGQPSFDVWRANFAPNGRTLITAEVNTRKSSTAAELRLTLACQGEIVASEISGRPCSDPPPQIEPGDTPECPLIMIDVGDLDFDDDSDGRIDCLAEIGTTQSLDIGTGGCTDPALADYRLRMTIDTAALALDLDANDCRAPESCLESRYGLSEADN